MSLVTQVSSLATRIATEFKTAYSRMGDLSTLTTTNKASLVAAVNEVKAATANAGAQINDAAPSGTTVYSSNKTDAQVAAAVAGIVNSAPSTLDTLGEIATQLAADESGATALTTAVGNRLRLDAAGSYTTAQQAQGRANLALGDASLHAASEFDTAGAGAAAQAYAIDRSHHTGTQSADTVIDGTTNKAYTAAEKTKLAGISGTNTGDQTTITGNAGSATKLQTARTINGVSFDGTANITVADTTKVPTTTTVNGHALSANVVVTATDIGLGSVNNTADSAKPVSTLQAAAIAAKLTSASNLADLADVPTARNNLSVYSQAQIGDPTTDFVATFNAAMVSA